MVAPVLCYDIVILRSPRRYRRSRSYDSSLKSIAENSAHVKQNVDVSCSECRWTYLHMVIGPWVLHYCWLFSIWTTRKMHYFQLFFSRTLSFNFQDFPEPKWFSRTFQVLEFSRKKSRSFQEAWETLTLWLSTLTFTFITVWVSFCARITTFQSAPKNTHITLCTIVIRGHPR